MAVQSSLLQRCFQEAVRLAGPMALTCLDEAVESLRAAETATTRIAERDALTLAWTGLLRLRGSWSAGYAAALERAFDASEAEGEPSGRGDFAPAAATGFGDLSLVDDAQVAQGIEFARLSQQLRLQVDPVMADLDALLSAAQGFDRVQPENNPLRPEVFAKALLALVEEAPADATVRARWLRSLAVPLGRELRGLYEKVLAVLREGQLQPVSYRVSAVPVGAAARGRASGSSATGAEAAGSRWGELGPAGAGGGWGGAGGSGGGGAGGFGPEGGGAGTAWGAVGGGDGGSGGWAPMDLSQAGVAPALFHDFLAGRGVPEAPVPLAPSYYEQGAAAALAGLPPLEPAGAAAEVLDERTWGEFAQPLARARVHAELRQRATHVQQVLGIEAVRRLVGEVAQDPRLLEPVREAIVALEPSLLRLAMVDPRFFSDDTHPGRRLMARVAQRSFRYRDTESPGFGEFFDGVRSTFNDLNRHQDIESGQPFNSALARLESAWARTDEAETAQREAVLQGLRFAEERQALANQIAYDMSSRPDLDQVPAKVLDFLFGPWALAMAHARLVDTSNQIDPRGFGIVVSDLVWSVKRDFILRDPAKLMDMIPSMLRTLTAGLNLIGLPDAERQDFFDVLLRLHEPVLRLRRLRARRDEASTGAAVAFDSAQAPLAEDLQPATPEQRVPKLREQPWMTPQERDRAGLEDVAAPTGSAPLHGGADDSAHAPLGEGSTDFGGLQAAGVSGAMPLEAAPMAEREAMEQVLRSLVPGVWVDLFARRRWRRAQLTWASANGALFMFIGHGGRTYTMTRRSLQRLLLQSLLRPVDTSDVVAQALEKLREGAQAAAEAAGTPMVAGRTVKPA
ncbi:MAG: hypothetical protein Fur0019_12320 [Tibeticola sp.]